MFNMLRAAAMLLAITLSGFSIFSFAETTTYLAQTTNDPEIPIDELELKLRPLMRGELKIEADTWLKLLEHKVAEISRADIAVKYKKQEISAAENLDAALEELNDANKEADAAEIKADKNTKLAKMPAAKAQDSIADSEPRKTVEEAQIAVNEAQREALETVKRVESAAEIQASITLAEKFVAEKKAAGIAAGEEPEENPENTENTKGNNPETQIDAARIKLLEAVQKREKDRANLLDYLTSLRTQQTTMIDRSNTVIAAYEKKGGAVEVVEEYHQYITAVSGIAVDISDMEATMKTISGWLLSDEGGLRLLKNISLFIIIVLAFMFIARLLAKAVERLTANSRQTSRLLSEFLVVSVRRLVQVVGVLIGLAALEINVGPLLAVIGAAGFVIAFALQDSLGNFASGILIMVFKPFDVGDLVEIGGVLGKVKSMNLLSVQIHTPDNKAVIIPNNTIWSGAIINVTGTTTRRIDLIFGIGYDDDIEKAQRVMEEVVSAHPLVLKNPEPVINVHELADSSVNFVCRPWVKTDDYWDVYWDITRTVKQRFDAEGVSIPFPQRDVHVYNTALQATTIAPEKPVSAPAPSATQGKKSASKHGGDAELDGDDA